MVNKCDDELKNYIGLRSTHVNLSNSLLAGAPLGQCKVFKAAVYQYKIIQIGRVRLKYYRNNKWTFLGVHRGCSYILSRFSGCCELSCK